MVTSVPPILLSGSCVRDSGVQQHCFQKFRAPLQSRRGKDLPTAASAPAGTSTANAGWLSATGPAGPLSLSAPRAAASDPPAPAAEAVHPTAHALAAA